MSHDARVPVADAPQHEKLAFEGGGPKTRVYRYVRREELDSDRLDRRVDGVLRACSVYVTTRRSFPL